MSKPRVLGEFEILVVAAIIRLGDAAYGARIRAEIESRTKRDISVGALYATLTRLQEKAYLSAHMGEATAERGGRAKRYYVLTAEGQAQFDRSLAVLNAMLDGIEGWVPHHG